MRKLLVLLLCLCLNPDETNAQGSIALGAESQVNTYTTSLQAGSRWHRTALVDSLRFG